MAKSLMNVVTRLTNSIVDVDGIESNKVHQGFKPEEEGWWVGRKINPASEEQQSLCCVNTFSEPLRRKEKELSSFGSS